jgi:hypothetical protein
MGCDIHPYIDYDESRGEGIFPDEEKFYTRSFAKLDGGRNYLLFGLLTNGAVRVSDAAGHAPDPKGLPSRLGYESEHDALMWVSEERWEEGGNCTYNNARSWAGGAHPSSQFVKAEWGRPLVYFDPKIHGELIDGLPEAEGKRFGWKVTHPDWHTYSWLTPDELEAALNAYVKVGKQIWPEDKSLLEVPAECRAWLWALRGLEEGGAGNPRLVFWFDN